MQSPDAAERVRVRIQDWLKKEGRGSKKRLAAAVTAKYGKAHGQQWVTGLITTDEKRGQKLRLKDLDAVADAMGVPPGDLVRRFDRNYQELTMAESRLVSYYRKLPEETRQHWLAWMDYLFRFQEPLLTRGKKIRDDMTDRMKQFETPGARSHAHDKPLK